MTRKRTNRWGRFVTENRRLLLFLLLAASGCIGGVLLHPAIRQSAWLSLVQVERVTLKLSTVLSGVLGSCFQPTLLLALLFLAGLSACGAPIALLIPVFWGLGMGTVQAYYYDQGWQGLLVIVAVVLPHSVMELVALLMAASESLRMSVRLSGVLLPRPAHCGGLWQEFRLYGIRFSLLFLLLLGAGAVDVMMRLLFKSWL